MDVESEQRFHDLEQRYISLKKEHDLVLVDKDALQGEHSVEYSAIVPAQPFLINCLCRNL